MFRTRSDGIQIGYDSIRIPARNGTDFGPQNNQVVFDLTRNVGMADLSNSYLEADVTIVPGTDTPRARFNPTCGFQSAIRTLNIRSEGRIIEQLNNYNIYANLHYASSSDEGVTNQRERTEGCAKDLQQVNNSWYASNVHNTATDVETSIRAKPITNKICMPLLGGLFQTSKMYPLMASPLEVEMILDEPEMCISIVEGVTDVPLADKGAGADKEEWNLSQESSDAFGAAPASVDIAAANNSRVGCCAFNVGDNVVISGTDSGTPFTTDTTITAIEEEGGGNLIKITVADDTTLTAVVTDAQITAVDSANRVNVNSNQTISYKIENPRIVISKVIPPPAQVQKVAQAMAKGAYTYNITSYTDYMNAIDKDVTSSTNIIPADLTRVKSILCAPILQQAKGNADGCKAVRGSLQHAKDYQFQVNNVLTPDRRVDLGKIGGNKGAFPTTTSPYPLPQYALGSKYNGLYLYEVEKALSAGNIPVRNLEFLSQAALQGRKSGKGSEVLGRSMGPYGLSQNLLGISTILYLNYSQTRSASTLLHNFVTHIRTINISPAGVQVFY